jgi:hypothetical protein
MEGPLNEVKKQKSSELKCTSVEVMVVRTMLRNNDKFRPVNNDKFRL